MEQLTRLEPTGPARSPRAGRSLDYMALDPATHGPELIPPNLHMTTTITPACELDFQVVDFVKTQRAAAQPAAALDLFCANGSIPQVIAKTC